MKDKLIVVFYADDEKKRAGNNIQNNEKRRDTYFKNASATLVSAKHYNPETDVALITNTSVPKEYADLLKLNGIMVFREEYDDFLFEDCAWSLAFYRFCALKHLIQKYEYERIIMLECDMYVQGSLDEVFEECKQHILLHDLEHRLSNGSYSGFVSEIEQFTGEKKYLTQYEGGFLAINRQHAVLFDKICHEIYEKMLRLQFTSRFGDMFILSLAACEMKEYVKNAAGYVHIFWTGWFRHVSTCYEKDPVCVLHVPDEKERGMIKIYDKFLAKGKFPENKKVWNMFHFKHMSFGAFIKAFVKNK